MYKYIIVGAGIAGCSVAHFLSKYTNDILLIDANEAVGAGASGAAGAFLSPLLGKSNEFKTLVTKSLIFSTTFYKDILPQNIQNCGVLRIPKDSIDREKFLHYEHDFEFTTQNDGYFFPIGSVVDSKLTCLNLTTNIKKLLNFKVNKIQFCRPFWKINESLSCENLILCTGANVDFLPEYVQIRPVWGQRIVCKTNKLLNHNYHKACSISKSFKNEYDFDDKKPYIISIGATHHRFVSQKDCNDEDTKTLLGSASDITDIGEIEVIDKKGGARSTSVDYFPMVGYLIDEIKTTKEFPHLKNGTHVKEDRFTRFDNLYILNGVGGRGFVLSPYLASQLVEYIINKKQLPNTITTDRLFKRWVKK